MAKSKSKTVTPNSGYTSPAWIKLWFFVSTIIVFWDAGFCLLRPLSFTHWLWAPYRLYQSIDLVYSPGALARYEGFTSAQAILNLVENALNMTFLVLERNRNPNSILVGMTGALFTFWKTTLYWLMDYMSGPVGWGQTGHNSTFDWWILFAVPNGFWIIVPFIISLTFLKELSPGLNQRAKSN